MFKSWTCYMYHYIYSSEEIVNRLSGYIEARNSAIRTKYNFINLEQKSIYYMSSISIHWDIVIKTIDIAIFNLVNHLLICFVS